VPSLQAQVTVTAVLFHPKALATGKRLVSVMDGTTESILNGPASILAAQLPATSHTWPDGIVTAAPLTAVDCVKGDVTPSARPDVASVAANPAVCVPRHHPAAPSTLQRSEPTLRERDGLIESISKGPASMLAPQLPARSHTCPEGMTTAAPLVVVVFVNGLE
jgi:hypothetical protein